MILFFEEILSIIVKFAAIANQPDVSKYTDKIPFLSEDTQFCVEPFDPSVIKAFALEKLCTTTFEGEECLELDAQYLKELGVMQKTARF